MRTRIPQTENPLKTTTGPPLGGGAREGPCRPTRRVQGCHVIGACSRGPVA